MRFFKMLLALFFIFAFQQQVNADVFSDTEHWAEHQYNEAREDAKKLEQQTEESARYVANKISHEATDLAQQMQNDINWAINELGKLTLDNLNGACKEGTGELSGPLKSIFTKGFNSKIAKGMPTLDIPAINGFKEFAFLGSVESATLQGVGNQAASCKLDEVRGYSCGIFPYVKQIVTAVQKGSSDSEALAKAAGKAYNSGACRNMHGLEDRAMCSVMVAAFDQSKKAFACMSHVVSDIAHDARSSHKGASIDISITADVREKVCVAIGGIAFGATVDAALGEMIPDKALQAKKVFKVAKLLRTALNLESKADVKIEKICHQGIKAAVESGEIPTEQIVRLRPHKNPGSHLELMTNLASPICLALWVKENKVGSWHCHGGANERWNFHNLKNGSSGKEGGSDSFWVESGVGTDKCLSATSKGKGYTTRKCDSSRPEQQFLITEAGSLKNKQTGQCINATGEKKYVVDAQCERNNNNQKMYKEDPSLSLVKGTPGSHRQLYANPKLPICLSINNQNEMAVYTCKTTPYQTWSFHSYKRVLPKLPDYFQIENDETGDCMTARGYKRTVKTEPCWAMHDEKHEQMYRIVNGKFQNLHTGYCLQTTGYHSHNKIIERSCDDNAAVQKWHILK